MLTSTTSFIITTLCRINKNFLIIKDMYINMQSRKFNAIIVINDEIKETRRYLSLRV